MNINQIFYCCVALFVAAFAIFVNRSEKQSSMPTDYKVFDTIEYYYDSENHDIIVYVFSINSSLAFSGIEVNTKQRKEKTDYQFKILSIYGGGKHTAIFKSCLDGGYLVSFPAKNFCLERDRVVYVGVLGNEHEIPFRGSLKEALFHHKLLPPDWRPPPINNLNFSRQPIATNGKRSVVES